MFYQSALRGVANPHRVRKVVYYGKVYRVRTPHTKPPGGAHRLKLEARMLEELLKERPGCEPVPGAPIERYEVFDRDTGNCFIMWRVPYQLVEQGNRDVRAWG